MPLRKGGIILLLNNKLKHLIIFTDVGKGIELLSSRRIDVDSSIKLFMMLKLLIMKTVSHPTADENPTAQRKNGK